MIFEILATAVILFTFYFCRKQFSNYWDERGVKNVKAYPIVGSTARVFLQKTTLSDFIKELHLKYPDEKLVGFYHGRKKFILVRDLELVKQVMVTDFDMFYDRGINYDTDSAEPMMKNLFTADGDLWKLLRQRMSPAFTSSKLKAMFPLIVEHATGLKSLAAAAARSSTEQDARDLMARFTTDFIGACGFGIDTKSLEDKDSVFRKLGDRIFKDTPRDMIIKMLKLTAPNLFNNLKIFVPFIETTTVNLVKNIMQQRNYKNSGRNDFIDLLIDLKQKGVMRGDSFVKKNADGSPKTVEVELDDLLISGQAFVFFAAGFHTTASSTSYLLHELAFHPEAQRRCQQEIDEALSRHDGKLCYEAVDEMKYLKMCFYEGLRMLSPAGFLSRRCVARYTFPGTNVTIDPGVSCAFSVHCLHTDPRHFPEPDEFIPERFHPDNVKNIKSCTYMPFGTGPRQCLGERLAIMVSLAGVAALLSQFSVVPSANTLRKPIADPAASLTQSVKGGLPLLFTLRKETS